MAAALPALMIGGTALSVGSTLAQGDIAAKAGRIKAGQYARNAKAAFAEGTRTAAEIRRQGEGIKSDAAAAMAAGGGVTDDVGAIEMFADIDQAIDYNALSAIYGGETRAADLNYAGKLAKWEGGVAKSASRMKAFSTVLSGAGSYIGMKK